MSPRPGAGRAGLAIAAAAALAVTAGCLALSRPDIPYATLEARYANAQSRYLDLPGGVRLHYRDQGDPAGPAVIMIHGYSASLEAWEPWVARLGRDFRIITLDLPGHGLTRAPKGYAATLDGYADLVDETARTLKLGRYVIVGNSMGGAVAWDDALRHGGEVRALVLVDAAGWPVVRPAKGGSPLLFKLMRNPLGRQIARHMDTRSMARKGLEAAYVDPALVTEALVDRYVDFSRAPGHADILLTIQSKPRVPVTIATFGAIAAPTLVMHGEADALIPLSDGEGFAGAIPGARLITYPGVGHVPMEQIPDRSAADLAAFLRALPAAATA